MRTEQLIGLLATGAGPAEPAGDGRRLLLGAALAMPVMIAAVWATLGFVALPNWAGSGTVQKLFYSGALLGAGVWLLRGLGRPGSAVRLPIGLVVLTLAGAAGAGLWDLLSQPVEAWSVRVFGSSSPTCPVTILALSIPAMVATMRAVRSLAPTQLRMAGAAAGLAAGSLAAIAYALGCTEGAMTFVALWYTLGIALATGLGAVIGPRALHW